MLIERNRPMNDKDLQWVTESLSYIGQALDLREGIRNLTSTTGHSRCHLRMTHSAGTHQIL